MEQRSLDVRLRCIPFGTADPCFLYGTGLLWPLYGTLWGLPYRKELFSVRGARLGMQPDRPGRKTAAQGFLRASTGNRQWRAVDNLVFYAEF